MTDQPFGLPSRIAEPPSSPAALDGFFLGALKGSVLDRYFALNRRFSFWEPSSDSHQVQIQHIPGRVAIMRTGTSSTSSCFVFGMCSAMPSLRSQAHPRARPQSAQTSPQHLPASSARSNSLTAYSFASAA